MIRTVVLWYFYTFLLINVVIGYVYPGALIHPGIVVRGIVLLLLIIEILLDFTYGRLRGGQAIAWFGAYVLTYSILTIVVNVPAEAGSLSIIGLEIVQLSKPFLILLLIYHVSREWRFYRERLPAIMEVNFVILTLNLALGFFFDIGRASDPFLEKSTKGLLVAGNSVSIMTVVFTTYFLFNVTHRPRYLIWLPVSLFGVYVVAGKAALALPVLFVVFLIVNRKSREQVHIRRSRQKRRPWVLVIVLIGVVAGMGSIQTIFRERFLPELVQRQELSFESSDSFVNTYMATRRAEFAVVQISSLIESPHRLLTGYGAAGQERFWIERAGPGSFRFAAMDPIDLLFRYGLLGTLLCLAPFVTAVIGSIANRHLDAISLSGMLLLLYSAFGGYVIFSLTSGTMLGLLFGAMAGRLRGEAVSG